MADFTGRKCIVCDNTFEKGDDIVVCPECGTPYHRSCYNEKGECINYSLHESGKSWQDAQQEFKKEFASDGDTVKCPRCGNENPPQTLFCERCGLPLGMNTSGAQQRFNDTQYNNPNANMGGMGGFGGPMGGNMGGMGNPMMGGMPFVQTQRVTPDMDLDGNTVGEYASFIGQNKPYFLAQFLRFVKTKAKSSFSFVGFLFPEYYFFYRKMFKEGIIALILTVLFTLPNMIITFNIAQPDGVFNMAQMYSALANDVNIESGAFNTLYNIFWAGSWVLQILCGVFANYWYYKKAKKTIEKAKALDGVEDSKAVIASKGGVSTGACILSIAIHLAITCLCLLAVKHRGAIIGWIK